MPQAPQAPISLVMTVRNEAANLPLLLDSVLAQTLRPAEIVIVDGGSTDGTPQVARSYMGRLPVRLVELPGANISKGRNAAIRSSGSKNQMQTWLPASGHHYATREKELGAVVAS